MADEYRTGSWWRYGASPPDTYGSWYDRIRPATPENVAQAQLDQAGGL